MEYVSIRVGTLRGDQKINFNAYIKINDKYVLYLREGDSFEGERLKRLKEKKVKKMFIIDQDETHYRDYLKRNIDMAYDNKSGKSMESRAEIIQGQQQSNTEQVFENPENEVVYGETKNSASQYVQFLLSNAPASSAILKIENTDRNLAHHGVAVSTLSVMLAQRLKVDQKLISLMALGALLHDMGHHDSQVNLQKSRTELSSEEQAIYKTHPKIGATRVQDKKHFDQLVIRIINEHEEHIDGTGFPQGLNESQQDPFSVMVSAANALDRYITFEGLSKTEAAKRLMVEKIGRHPLNYLQVLGEVIKSV